MARYQKKLQKARKLNPDTVLTKKIAASLLAMGMIALPGVAWADIGVLANSGTSISSNAAGTVHTVTTTKVVGNSSINQFTKFDLPKGNIANLHLANNTVNQFNLVYGLDKVNINGIVNAVKDGRIGGNAYFLSSNGIVVGSTGVINAGSVHLYVPSDLEMLKLGAQLLAPNVKTRETLNRYIDGGKVQADGTISDISLNVEGRIEVKGRISAPDGLSMHAADISIGTNEAKALLQTGDIDFANLVNANVAAEGSMGLASSGLSGDLVLRKSEDGNIVLEAKTGASPYRAVQFIKDAAETVDDVTYTLSDVNNMIDSLNSRIEALNAEGGTAAINETMEGLNINISFPEGVSIPEIPRLTSADVQMPTGLQPTDLASTVERIEGTVLHFLPQNFETKIDIKNADVKSAGSVIVKADATNGNNAQLSSVKAEVAVRNGSSVTAAQDVSLSAKADNTYVDTDSANHSTAVKMAAAVSPVKLDVSYAKLASEANIILEEETKLKADNGSVELFADSKVGASLGTSNSGNSFFLPGASVTSYIPSAGITYINAFGKANISSAGSIEAGKDVKVAADSELNVVSETINSVTNLFGDANKLALSLGITNADNAASVDLKQGAEIKAGGATDINAHTNNSLRSTVASKAGSKSMAVLSVNITDFDSNADVNINGDIQSVDDVSINAGNDVAELISNTSDSIGKSKKMVLLQETLMNNLQVGTITNNIKNWGGFAKTKLTGSSGSGGGSAGSESDFNIADYITGGASISYAAADNRANVNIGNVNIISSDGDVSLNAKSVIDDVNFTASGVSNAYAKDDQAEVVVNASVVYGGLKNNAKVNIAAGNKSIKGQNVTVNAQAQKNYNRVANMVKEVKENYENWLTALRSIKDIPDNVSAAVGDENEKLLAVRDSVEELVETCEFCFAQIKDITGFSADEMASSEAWSNLYDENPSKGEKVTGLLTEALVLLNNVNDVRAALADLGTVGSEEVKAITQPWIDSASTTVDLLESAVKFANPASYVEFAATSKAGAADTTAAIAGNVLVTNIDNKSHVVIGKGRGIEANNELLINADNQLTTTSMVGLNVTLFSAKGGDASLGGTVIVQDMDNEAVVAVAETAKLNAGTMNIKAKNDVGMYGVGMAGGDGGVGISGTFNMISGRSDAIVSVDDAAILSGKKNDITVEDENGNLEDKKTDGVITVAAENETTVVNVAGGLSMGKKAGVGASIAVNALEVMTLATVDNNKDVLRRIWSEEAVQQAGLASSTEGQSGAVDAYGINVTADTTGTIAAVSVAGGVVSGSQKPPKTEEEKKKEEAGFSAKLKNLSSMPTQGPAKLADKITGEGSLIGKVAGIFAAKTAAPNGEAGNSQVSGAMNSGADSKQGGGKTNADSSDSTPSVTLAGAGSVSLNMLENATEALIKDSNITLNTGDANVKAKDGALDIAASGAAAVNWQGGNSSGTSVAVAGAAGVNVIDNTIRAAIENTDITNVKNTKIQALSGGTEIGLGLGLTLVNAQSGYTGGASVSVNLIDHDVKAELINSAIEGIGTNQGIVDVTAYERDLQITGGVNVNAGKTKASVGGAVTIADINNTVNANISQGSNISNVRDVKVQGLDSLTSVTAAVGVAVAAGSDGNAFSGSVVYSGLDNEVSGNISDSVINVGGTVQAIGKDIGFSESSSSNTYNEYTEQLKNHTVTNESVAEKLGADIDGSSLIDVDTSNVKDDRDASDTGLNLANDDTSGSRIITAAVSVAASGNAAAGAAVNVTDLDYDFSSGITGSSITAQSVQALTEADNFIVGVAGGVAASGKFGGMGSVSWQDINNDNTATIAASDITADSTIVKASTGSLAVNVGGQVAASTSGVAVGAVLAYNDLDNNTGAYLLGNTVHGGSVEVDAQNGAGVYSVGAQVAAASEVAVSGTVAINTGKNDTEAIIDNYIFNNEDNTVTEYDSNLNKIKSVDVTAGDDTRLMSAVVGVTAGGNVAVGAGVALTNIGALTGGEAQKTAARIDNTAITAEDVADISVKAVDKSQNITAAVGVGGAGTAAVQGSAATALTNKDVVAGLKNTTTSGKETLTVSTQNTTDVYTTAIVAAGAGTAAVGAGVAVNRIHESATAGVTGGNLKVTNMDISANAAPGIWTVGVGGAGAGTAAVAGSFAVNMIDNDVSAEIKDAFVNSTGNVGVVAGSDEIITNYAGAVSGSGTAAVGLASAVNYITGSTEAVVENSSVTAKGSLDEADLITVKSGMRKDSVIDSSVNVDANTAKTLVGTALRDGRISSEKSGLVVDSSATHSITSIMATGGFAGVAAGMGTVNVNSINGNTTAEINHSNINDSLQGRAGADVFVEAADYTNAMGFTGAVSGGMTASVGAVADTNLVSRKTEALIKGGNRHALQADDLTVQAYSEQGLFNFDISASLAIEGGSVGGTVSYDDLSSETRAKIEDMDISVDDDMQVAAEHKDHVILANTAVSGAAIGAGVGLTAGIVKEASVIEVGLVNTSVQGSKTASDISVDARNTSDLATMISSGGIAGLGAGAAGTTAVNNMTEKVLVNITDSAITAHDIAVTAENNVDVLATGGTAGLGAGGFGVSVSVNTFDDTVEANVIGSRLDAAGRADVTAQNNRDIEQVVVNVAGGAVAGGANIMVTNVNKEIGNSTEAEKQTRYKLSEAEEARTNNNQIDSIIGLSDDESGAMSGKTSAEVSYGGVDGAGVHVNVEASTIKAVGTAIITAGEKSDVDMHGGSAVVGGASINGSVGILNAKHDTKVALKDANIAGSVVSIQAIQGDKKDGTDLSLYQGTGGILAWGAAYGSVSTSGATKVSLTDTNINANNELDISAVDASSASINAYGLTAGAIAAGAIVAKSENDSSADVELKTTKAYIDNNGNAVDYAVRTLNSGTMTVNAYKSNNVKAKAVGGAAGVAAGVGIDAGAYDNGRAAIAVSGNRLTVASRSARFNALNDSQAIVDAGSGAAGLDAVQVTLSEANVKGSASLTIADDNTFAADSLEFNAQAGQSGKITAAATTVGVGLGADAVGVNEARAITDTDVNVNIGREEYVAESEDADDTELTISGINQVSRRADVSSLTVGGLFALGNGLAKTQGTDTVTVSAGGGDVQSLNLFAAGTSEANAHANGDGGGLADISPQAAKAVNYINSSSKGTMSGSWNIKDCLSAKAYQTDIADMQAEAIHVGALDVTGVQAKNFIGSNANDDADRADAALTIMSIDDGAQINVGGTVDVGAKNIIRTGQKYAFSVDGKVYGGLAVNLDKTTEVINKAADVTIGRNAVINSSGAQVYEASTDAVLKNNLRAEAAGAIDAAVGETKNVTTLTDQVTLGEGAVLNNKGSYSAGGITLSAYDNLSLTATADTEIPAGLGGYLTALSNNVTSRNTAVTVNGDISSSKDINLYAGKTATGERQTLRMNLGAATYNHTAVPVATSPAINNELVERNRVVVGQGTEGSAVGHINISANSGKESIIQATSLYSWIKGGGSEERSYVGNAEGTSVFGQHTDNYAELNGKLKAGSKSNVVINIAGTVVPDDSLIANGSAAGTSGSYTISVTNGGEEDLEISDGIKYGSKSYANILARRWKELNNLIQNYDGHGSDKNDVSWTAYNGYKAELQALEDEMETLHLLEVDTIAGVVVKTPITEGLNINYVEIPELAVSGGNITVTADNLKGSGEVTAKGSPSASITNNSTAYMIIDGIEVGDAGGELIYNGVSIGDAGNAGINDMNANSNYKADLNITTFAPSGDATVTILNEYTGGGVAVKPKNISNLTPEETVATKLFNPLSTIEVAGSIVNSLGGINITNRSGDIMLNASKNGERVSVSGRNVRMEARGSIVQGFTDGIKNVGGNPEYIYADYGKDKAAEVAGNHTDTENWSETISARQADVQEYLQSYNAHTLEISEKLQNYNGSGYSLAEYLEKQNSILNADNAPEFNIVAKTQARIRLNNAMLVINAALTGKDKLRYAQILLDQAAELANTKEGRTLLGLAEKITNDASTGSNTAGSGEVAGGNVYMAASYINVNGTVQSGYGKYSAEISADALDDVDSLQQVNLGDKVLYKVNDGGRAVREDNGSYSYVVQVYYDPTSDSLLVEDVDTGGGKIFLTGRIASTGNGKLYAADGGAEIIINNKTGKEINLGKVINNDIDGSIVILDTYQDKQTTYTRNGTQVIDNYSGYLNAVENKDSYIQNNAASSTYNTKAGLRYFWTEGTSTTTKETYQNDVRAGLWGAVVTQNTTELANYEQEHKDSAHVVTLAGAALPEGAFISDIVNSDAEYQLIANNVVTDSKRSDIEHWMTKSGFLGWFRTHHYRWTVTTGSSQTYINSMKADKAISIGFLGSENGSIDISSGGGVNLKGNVINNTAAAAASIKSVGGAITQFNDTSITGNNIELTANNGINDISLISLGTQVGDSITDNINLSAATKTGNINITAQGGFLGNTALAGDVNLIKLESGKGNVGLDAMGNIAQIADKHNAYNAVKGDRIDLTSAHGFIMRADGNALSITAGQEASSLDPLSASVNAIAQRDIRLAQTEGDMRIGRIVSENGDVALSAADGRLVDALPSERINNNVDVETMVKRWVDAGLIAGDATYEGAYVKKLRADRDNYAQAIADAFAEYQTLQTYYTENADAERSAAYEVLAAKFANYATSEAYLAVDADYQAKAAEADNPTFRWTKEDLLYAVKDAIINKTSGSTDTEGKIANISGNNITLTAKSGVGLNSSVAEVISVDDLTLENLKKLAGAVASDVTTVKDEDGNVTKFVINGKVPLGLKGDGVLNVAAKGNVYVASRRDDSDSFAAINLGTVAADTGNVSIMGRAGITNALSGDGANIVGNDLLIEGGNADSNVAAGAGAVDIGAVNKPVTVALAGALSAHTDGSVYISSVIDDALRITELYAGNNAELRSLSDIVMAPDTDLQAYLHAGNIMNLYADGNVGSENTALRILANGVAVNVDGNTASEAGDVYLSGVKGINVADEQTILYLGSVHSSGKVAADSDGALQVGRDEQVDDEGAIKVSAVVGSVAAKDDSVLTAKDIVLNGSVAITDDEGTIIEGKTLKFTALEGGIRETVTNADNSYIKADILRTASKGSQILQNVNNAFHTFNAEGIAAVNANGNEIVQDIDGNILVKTHGGSNILVGINSEVNGDIEIINLDENGGMTIGTDLTANKGKGADENGHIRLLGNGTIDITKGKDVKAAEYIDILTTRGNINVGGGLDAGTDINASVEGDGDINYSGRGKAGNDINSNIGGSGSIIIAENADLGAGRNILSVTANGAIVNNSNITAGQNVKLLANNGDIAVNANVTAQRGDLNIELNGGGDITDNDNGTTMQAGRDAFLSHNGTGDIDLTNIIANNNANVMHNGIGDINIDDIRALNGDVNVIHSNIGNVGLGNVMAEKGTAAVTVYDGDLTVGKISARDILLGVLNKNRRMEISSIDAERSVGLRANRMHIGTITQKDNAEKPLLLDTRSYAEDQPIQNIAIDHIRARRGTVMPQLWAAGGSINVDEGDIRIKKLYALRKISVTTRPTNAAVYGIDPLREGNAVVYWNDLSKNNPQDDLSAWYDDRMGRWMYLDISNSVPRQISNGVLIDMQNYHYVYNQRYSAVNIMQHRTARDAKQMHDLYNTPEISRFERYSLPGIEQMPTQNNLPYILIARGGDEYEIAAEQ